MNNIFTSALGLPQILRAILLSWGAIATITPTPAMAIATPDVQPETQTPRDLPPGGLSFVEGGPFTSPQSTLNAEESSPVPVFSTDQEPLSADVLAQTSGSCDGGMRVESLRGNVTFEGRPIQVGDCFQPAIGTWVTEENSNARLRFDNFRGSLEVDEVSEFEIESLADENVELFVRQGQVRFSLGRLTRDLVSELEGTAIATKTLPFSLEDPLLTQDRTGGSPFRVRTPTGVAGVRGTSFGVDVGPNGQTGVRTVDGSVSATALGQEVLLGNGQFTVIAPGLAPTAPQPIPAESKLQLLVTQPRGSNRVLIHGKIDSPDIVLLNGEPIVTNPDGSFSLLIPRPASRRLRFVVRGPAVRERVYSIPVQ
ncbi:FecR family protein [Laspinema olomoucense]|uniref:FecR family protein n=1 Tax=Laspinema olomoucense D3b TaxID=2953688 RepID=A0ABT2NBH3_9CYAN|nr:MULTISPECIES: FecR family protein [unclassified Laspinema]MCT7980044.1 FecR family protein [Laspinema sp. D3b]MCT7990181.1 FecR family protein [Laspinema sp. D3a]